MSHKEKLWFSRIALQTRNFFVTLVKQGHVSSSVLPNCFLTDH